MSGSVREDGARAEIVVEHIEYRAPAAQHDAFLAAFLLARQVRLATRGCRSVELTRGDIGHDDRDETAYRARVEWRSREEHDAFVASEAAAAAVQAMAAFPSHAHHVATRLRLDLARGKAELDGPSLRRAFGHYPTGVAVITAIGPQGPAAMIVGSFTSVSLAPALVSFCAAHTSTSWPVIADAGSCCVNFLEASQGEVCRTIAQKRAPGAPPVFSGVPWTAAPSGAPILDGVVGWLDCRVAEVRVAGDHDLILLEVLAHDANPERLPLLFHRSAYRTLATSTD